MAKIGTTEFDAADYLNTAEDVVAYIDTYLEDGSSEEVRAAMDTVTNSRGISELAKRTERPRASLSKALARTILRLNSRATCNRL